MFKGKRNLDMGFIPKEEDFFIKAPQRTETIAIDGKDGSIVNAISYENVEGSIEFSVTKQEYVDAIFSWLNGKGEFIFNNRKTTMYFYNQIDLSRKGGHKEGAADYLRSPFWHKVTDDYITVTDKVINEGNIESKPIIRLEGTGSTEIKINDVLFTYTFSNTGYVEIDCDSMNETSEGMNMSKNLEIGFQYPFLNVGENEIVVNSGNPIIKIKRKDRWL